MADARKLIPRHAERLVTEALGDTRGVAVNGARQVGKSTLARTIAAAASNPLIRLLDDPATLRAALDDPADFVHHDGLLVIDEVQLAPELFRAIKVAVDADPRPGRYLLTGSHERITIDPGRMGGLPCIRDTRVTVTAVLGQLAAARTVDEVLDDYPYIERDDVLAALEFAAVAVQERELPITPTAA